MFITPAQVARAARFIIPILVVLSLAGQCSRYFLGHGHLFGFVRLFHLDSEGNVPTLISTLGLILCCTVCLVIAARERTRAGWQWMALILACFALDEMASIHEELIAPIRRATELGGALHFTWVVVGLPAAVLALVMLVRFTRTLPRPTCIGMLSAAACYFGGAIGVEMIGGLYASQFSEESFMYEVITTCEEGLELVGIAWMLRTLAAHAGSLDARLSIRFEHG